MFKGCQRYKKQYSTCERGKSGSLYASTWFQNISQSFHDFALLSAPLPTTLMQTFFLFLRCAKRCETSMGAVRQSWSWWSSPWPVPKAFALWPVLPVGKMKVWTLKDLNKNTTMALNCQNYMIQLDMISYTWSLLKGNQKNQELAWQKYRINGPNSSHPNHASEWLDMRKSGQTNFSISK